MRGKRKLKKIEAMSDRNEDVFECDLCIWMLRIPVDRSFTEAQAEFDAHDCKVYSLKKKIEPEKLH